MTTTPTLGLTQFEATDTINFLTQYNTDLSKIDTNAKANQSELDTFELQLAQKVNQVDLDATNAAVYTKAEKTYVDNKIENIGNTKTYMGTLALYSSLPTSYGVNDRGKYFYVSQTGYESNYCWSYNSDTSTGEWNNIGDNLNLGDNTVTPNTTTFAHKSLNLFNANDVTLNSYVSTTDGVFVTGVAGYTRSDYIPIDATKLKLSFKTATQIAFYNSSKTFISGSGLLYPTGGGVILAVNIPSNASYVVFSCESTFMTNMMVNYGSTLLTYEAYDTVARLLDNIRFPEGIYGSSDDVATALEKLNHEDHYYFLLPDNLYVVDGKELWLWWNNIVHLYDVASKLPIECISSQKFNKDKTIITANGTLNLDVYDYSYGTVWSSAPTKILSKSITVTKKTVASGKTINTLIIGDSYIAVKWGNGVMGYMSQLAQADGNTINFKGTKNSYDAYYSEAVGGWSEADFYSNSSSPFVFNGVFDFTQYLSNSGITNIDNIVFFLGMNGGTGSNINAMIADIKTDLPNCKFFVCGVPSTSSLNSVTDLDYSDLLATQAIRNIQNLMYLNNYFNNKETSNIYFVPTNACFNRHSGLITTDNYRYQFSDLDATKETQYSNHHPTPEGAKELAYMIYNHLLYFTT